MADTVLVVEDEAPVRELLVTWLEEAGYAPRSASNGLEGLREVYQARPDVIVADILMPQMDGFEFCRLVREVTDAPIMFLTGLGEEARKVEGLNLGADDYIVKPVGMDEFLARITALLRRRARSSKANSEPRRYSDPILAIDFDRHEARLKGKTMDLTPTE
ncbi:MAG: response regulator transcription factor, partial [SAR202 cluster bacterium]|nr:response regulator transcription factor [SAR202 cluster bacterium]